MKLIQRIPLLVKIAWAITLSFLVIELVSGMFRAWLLISPFEAQREAVSALEDKVKADGVWNYNDNATWSFQAGDIDTLSPNRFRMKILVEDLGVIDSFNVTMSQTEDGYQLQEVSKLNH